MEKQQVQLNTNLMLINLFPFHSSPRLYNTTVN